MPRFLIEITVQTNPSRARTRAGQTIPRHRHFRPSTAEKRKQNAYHKTQKFRCVALPLNNTGRLCSIGNRQNRNRLKNEKQGTAKIIPPGWITAEKGTTICCSTGNRKSRYRQETKNREPPKQAQPYCNTARPESAKRSGIPPLTPDMFRSRHGKFETR